MLGISKVVYVCDNYIIIYLSSTHFIKSYNNYIYQPNNIDIVIITPSALVRWSYTNQFSNSD